ncbi:unnamed protein product [Linum tenue]|uniref:Transcription initiation factor TFIID component TAF4 C-terminal domain-containing protein n=1 Tax=Linum tenue TaxID=586396 RepID=A0AAV0MZH0_9ROSI|nr:unnamed protein product [Linum tenue]
MIRMSKQRIDLEKARHKTVVTSDVRQQLVVMNQKAKDEWDRKLAEAELRRVNEPDTGDGAEGDKETEGGRGKAPKLSKEEDVKMRTRAANMMAARAAVGGSCMFEEKVGGKKFGRSQVAGAQLMEVRSLTIKDVDMIGGWNERPSAVKVDSDL